MKDFGKAAIRNSAYVLVLNLIQMITAFGVQIMLARLLAPRIFGIYAISSSIMLFAIAMTNYQVDKYLLKEQDGIQDKLNAIFTIEFVIALITLIMASLLSVIILHILDRSGNLFFTILLCFSVFYTPFNRTKACLQREMKFIHAASPKLIAQILSAAIAIVCAYHNAGIWSLLVFRLGSYFFEDIFLWFLSPLRPRLAYDKVLFSTIHRFCWPLFFAAIFLTISNTIDYYIIAYYASNTALGFYWMAFQLTTYMLLLKTSLNYIVYVYMSKIIKKDSLLKIFDLLVKVNCFIFLLPVIIGFLWAKDIIPFIFGPAWSNMVIIIQLFLVVVLFNSIAYSIQPLMLIYGKVKAELWGGAINLLLLIPAVMIGVKYYGIVGAAAGALFVSVVYGLIIYGLYIRTIMHKWWQYFCLPILLCSLLAYMTFAKISITLKISLLAIVLISYFGFYLFNNVKNFLAIRKEIQLGSFYG